ncbi:MAG: peptidase S24 [Gammaproteobacteria bacterium]|nr:MAG: peptidase S24 [Gammaproteobacteria bacterium]
MLTLKRIEGDSMSPSLQNGDYILACLWPRWLLKPKQIIVLKHPIYGDIIKRIDTIDEQGQLTLIGDNHRSVSREAMGKISKQIKTWKVIKRIKP